LCELLRSTRRFYGYGRQKGLSTDKAAAQGFVEKDNYEAYFGMAFDSINAFAAGMPENMACLPIPTAT
jgi:hypothetical protein